jgi:hypothetical protein
MVWMWMVLGMLAGLGTSVWAQEACVPQVTTKQHVTLSWVAPAPGLPVHEYQLEQQTDGGAWTSLPAPVASATTQRVSGLLPEHTYGWRLRAVYREPDGGLTVSAYAPPGPRPPCVRVIGAAPPTEFSATPD